MAKYVIERYENFNIKGCTNKIIFGIFNDQPIPPDYNNLLNDDNDDVNNITGTPADYALPEKKGAKDAVTTNEKDTNNEIIIHDGYSLASEIDPPSKKILKLKEWKMKMNEGLLKEWTRKTKDST